MFQKDLTSKFKQTLRIISVLFICTFFVACSSKNNTTKTASIDISKLKLSADIDTLGIGEFPTEPSKKLKLIQGVDNTQNVLKLQNLDKIGDPKILEQRSKFAPDVSLFQSSNLAPNSTPPLAKSSPQNYPHKDIVNGPNRPVDPSDPFDDTHVFYNQSYTSDFVSIIAQNDALITVWALASGNWVWGYSPLNSQSFGDAKVWQLIIYPKNYVMIRNKLTNNCLNAYQNGVVHYPCQITNQAQFWQLNSFTNGAIQIKNFGTGKCLATPYNKGESYYPINLVPCTTNFNIDQQWQIIPPAISTTPIPQ